MSIMQWGADLDLIHATVNESAHFIERSVAHSSLPKEEALRRALAHLRENWMTIAERFHRDGWRKYASEEDRHATD